MFANRSCPKAIGQTSRWVSRTGAFLALSAALFVATIASAEPLIVELESATTGFDQRTGKPVLNIRLKDSFRRVFAIFSGNNVGRKVQLRVDGNVLHSSVIREPLLGGSFQLAASLWKRRKLWPTRCPGPGLRWKWMRL